MEKQISVEVSAAEERINKIRKKIKKLRNDGKLEQKYWLVEVKLYSNSDGLTLIVDRIKIIRNKIRAIDKFEMEYNVGNENLRLLRITYLDKIQGLELLRGILLPDDRQLKL